MATYFEKTKLVESFARWLAGFPPKWGKRHYFTKYNISMKIESLYNGVRGKNICVFCGKRYRKRSALVQHLINVHYREIEELFSSTS